MSQSMTSSRKGRGVRLAVLLEPFLSEGASLRPCRARGHQEASSGLDLKRVRWADSTQEAVKPDDAGRKKFTQLFEDLYEVQDTQNTDQDAKGGAAAAVRSGTALARLAHIGLKRSKNIVQGGGSFNVKDFVKHLKNKFPGSVAEEDADVSLDWKKNSKVPSLRLDASKAHKLSVRI